MSNRTLRRAAERAARKAARKQNLATPAVKTLTATAGADNYDHAHIASEDTDRQEFNVESDHSAERASSAHRIAANRANAQKSTGPTSQEGKAVSSLNAVKHGLTGNTVLLATDDAEAYQQRLDAHVEQYKPVTFEERRLVQSIHDHAWRLDRILNLESTIYAKGRFECAFFYQEIPEEQRASYIQLEISERYEKQLRNLHTQEARLQGQRARDIKALAQIQQQRKAEEQSEAEKLQSPARPAPLQTNGFVFTTPNGSFVARSTGRRPTRQDDLKPSEMEEITRQTLTGNLNRTHAPLVVCPLTYGLRHETARKVLDVKSYLRFQTPL